MSIKEYTIDFYNHPAKYQKFMVALAGFFANLAAAYFADGLWVAPLLAFLTALGVVVVPNKK